MPCSLILLALLPGQGAPRLEQPPHALPLFAFLKECRARAPIWMIRTHSVNGVTQRFPEWQYLTAMPAQSFAHLLKSRLTAKTGWSLRFPNLKQAYDAAALHRTRGIVDWELKSIAYPPNSKFRVSILVTHVAQGPAPYP